MGEKPEVCVYLKSNLRIFFVCVFPVSVVLSFGYVKEYLLI